MTAVDLTVAGRRIAQLRTFGSTSVSVEPLHNATGREKCFRVDPATGSGAYKVRFTVAFNELSAATEYEALRVLHEVGVPWAPRIYEFDDREPACLVTGYQEGESLDKSSRWAAHADAIVSGLRGLLSDIHSVRGGYFGHLAGPQYPSWNAFLETRLSHHMRAAMECGGISRGDVKDILALHERARRELEVAPPVLLHSDVKPANILFDQMLLKTMLVDFELARFGDPDFEWVMVRRLALRRPAYRQLVAEPLLRAVGVLGERSSGAREAKLLLYSLYQTCSFLAFEWQHRLPVPVYRTEDLRTLLQQARELR
jgi:aminoglycoside phosphotransferase (APT) family kinase protein